MMIKSVRGKYKQKERVLFVFVFIFYYPFMHVKVFEKDCLVVGRKKGLALGHLCAVEFIQSSSRKFES